jgi:hypothetical protein
MVHPREQLPGRLDSEAGGHDADLSQGKEKAGANAPASPTCLVDPYLRSCLVQTLRDVALGVFHLQEARVPLEESSLLAEPIGAIL